MASPRRSGATWPQTALSQQPVQQQQQQTPQQQRRPAQQQPTPPQRHTLHERRLQEFKEALQQTQKRPSAKKNATVADVLHSAVENQHRNSQKSAEQQMAALDALTRALAAAADKHAQAQAQSDRVSLAGLALMSGRPAQEVVQILGVLGALAPAAERTTPIMFMTMLKKRTWRCKHRRRRSRNSTSAFLVCGDKLLAGSLPTTCCWQAACRRLHGLRRQLLINVHC